MCCPTLLEESPYSLKSYTSSPGKAILFGEYAVLLGYPAYVWPLPQRLSIEMEYTAKAESYCKFSFPQELRDVCYSLKDLKQQANDIQHQWNDDSLSLEERVKQFQTNSCLLRFLAGSLLADHPGEWKIKVQSQLLIGSGQGSSGALIISFLKAFYKILGTSLSTSDFLKQALNFEGYQHGQSSGVDVAVSYYNQPLKFQRGNKVELLSKDLSLPLVLVDTGRPLSSTGEGVVQIIANKFILQKMYQNVQQDIEVAFEKPSPLTWHQALKAAHRWLVEGGVVPSKVQDFVRLIELRGGAAKPSGAGTLRGENGGMLLVSCEEAWQDLVKDYGYHVFGPFSTEN